MEKSKFVVETLYNHIYKLIFLHEPSLNLYLEKCKEGFGVTFESAKVRLTTKLGSVIPPDRFQNVLEVAGPFYTIHLYLDELDGTCSIVTPNDIKQYLIDKNATNILNENDIGPLTEKSRRQLIRHVSEYQMNRFGQKPTPKQKMTIATAVSFVFPSLSANVVKGFCGIRANNERAAAKKCMSESSKMADRTDEDCAAEIEDLKTMKICTENMAIVKQKLVDTLKYRVKMIDVMEMDLLETFPYFFTDPSLILFDFSKRYPNVNSNALMDEWENIRKRLISILANQFKTNIQTLWPREIHDLLILLKLVHAKVSKNLLSVDAFNKAIGKLIVFRKNDVPPRNLPEKSNNHPYIIACGESIDNITHYYIELEKHLMSVPKEYNFAETFDLFLKAHESIGLNFDPNIKPMAHFCLHFIYGLKKINRPSPFFINLSNSIKVIEA